MIHQDCWQHFCDSLPLYHDGAVERAERIARQARIQREQEEQARKQRVADFLSVLTIPGDWAGLTDKDREWIAEVDAHHEASNQATDDDVRRSVNLSDRYARHDYAINAGKPHVLRQYLHDQLDAIPSDWRDTAEFGSLWYEIRDAGREEDFDELKALSAQSHGHT